MLSMPLAYPSTLDRRGPACPPAYVVLRGGVLEPVSSPPKLELAGKSRRLFAERIFSAEGRGVFLSQAGPRFDSVLLKLGITS